MANVVKCTMLMEIVTQVNAKSGVPRIGGWSESWYYNGDESAALTAMTKKGGLCELRANLLPRTGLVVGERTQIVEPAPVGASTTHNVSFPGGNDETDIPSMALLVSLPAAGSQNIKRLILRGLPDINVDDGEFVPVNGYDKRLTAFIKGTAGFAFRGTDFTNHNVPVRDQLNNGRFTTVTPHGFQVGDTVKYTRGKAVNGDLVSFTAKVTAIPTQFTFDSYVFEVPAESRGGSVRKFSYIYPVPNVNAFEVERAINRKVGRPFLQFRGRR